MIPVIFLVVLTFATGGHSVTFARAYEAAKLGDVSKAADLFSVAVERTFADASPAKK